MFSDRAKQTLAAYKSGEIDRDYVISMDLTGEEREWVLSEGIELDWEGDELEIQGTVRTWGTPTGDKVMPPIEDHHYIFLAGKQGAGKTSLSFFIAEQNAKLGLKVIIYSMEMSCEQLIRLNARKTAGITKEQWRNKKLITDRQKEVYRKRKENLKPTKEKPLMLIGGGDWEKKGIKDILEDIEKNYKFADLVIIDNLDLIQGSGDHMENNARQEEISRSLLQWTNENNTPIIMIHHLKKDSKGTVDDMRGSGKLSDDADIVIMVSRPTGEGITEQEKTVTNLFVGKDRDWGEPLVHKVQFNRGQFIDYEDGF